MSRDKMIDELMDFANHFSQMRVELFSAARPAHVTPLQFEILIYCHCCPNVSLSRISQCLAMAVPNCSREVKKLVEMDLVLRRPSESDRRQQIVSLSEQGSELVKIAYADLRIQIGKRFSHLNETQIDEMEQAFHRLSELFQLK